MNIDSAIVLLERIHEGARARERLEKRILFSGVQHVDFDQALNLLRAESLRQNNLARRQRFQLYVALVCQPDSSGFVTDWQDACRALKTFEECEEKPTKFEEPSHEEEEQR